MLYGNENSKVKSVCFTFLLFALLLFLFCGVSSGQMVEQNKNVFMIPLPDPCSYVERVEKGKVFINRRDGMCTQVISVTSVRVDPDDEGYLTLYYRGNVWKRIKVRGNIEDLAAYVDEVSRGFNIQLPESGPHVSDELRKRLEEISAYYFSDEFQQRVESERERLARLILPEDMLKPENNKGPYDPDHFRGTSLLRENERLYIFVSRSIPEETIRAFVRRAELLQSYERVFFVLRGGIDGLTRIRPTVEWVARMIVRNPDCLLNLDEKEARPCELYRVKFIIDPLLFRRYKIGEVPAVVYVRGIQPQFGYSEGLEEVKVEDYFVSYGDADLMYHLYMIGLASGEKKFVEFSSRYLRN